MLAAPRDRRPPLAFVALLALLGGLLVAPKAARAIDLLGERVQIHGFVEEQIRAISDDFDSHLDLTQWYTVLTLETDLQILPDGWGPFDSIGGFVRTDVRYDCVWTRACGLSGSTNVFGNRSRVLPERLSQARNTGLSGVTRFEPLSYRQPEGKIATQNFYPQNPFSTPPLAPLTLDFRGFNQLPSIDTLLGVRQVVNGTEYLPAQYTFQRYLNYGFALRSVKGTEENLATQVMPWDPKDDIDPQSTLADRVNPFRAADRNPITGLSGSAALPFRPAPRFGPKQGAPWEAKGIFYPSKPYADYLRDGGSDPFDQNFSQERLAWNLGASQEQTWFLREAYLDLNFLEGSLFVRLGKQTIVWGKTELFATTDQFNPNDLALASLARLEETRIPVWAARAIYSFYDIGPVNDVRLEVAVDLDTFYPNDLGRCGEPYTPNPVCNKTYGLLAHGIAGLGLAGEDRPDHWWDSAEGLQFGARLEFRWERFSFALVDFYNYDKLPYQARLTTFERNVDPGTGRPRRINQNGACNTGMEPSCLTAANALTQQSVNQQYFAFVCSASVGFSSLDRSVCAQSVFNSTGSPIGQVTSVISQIVAGSPFGIGIIRAGAFTSTAYTPPLVSLSIDPGDPPPTVAPGEAIGPIGPNIPFPNTNPGPGAIATYNNHNLAQSITSVLKPEQQALLGCGPFYGIPCDVNPGGRGGGIDLLNAEASALVQSWAGFDGQPLTGFRTDVGAQPGTVGYNGGPVCTRMRNGRQVKLPGCRGPRDRGYNPAVDGANTGAAGARTFIGGDGNAYPVAQIGYPAGVAGVAPIGDPTLNGKVLFTQGHPFTGAPWVSELAALSWNYQVLLVALSDAMTTSSGNGLQLIPGRDPTLSFDFRTAASAYRVGGCSFIQPQFCSNIRALWAVIGNTRNTEKAGGNSRFGRRDFVWSGGGDSVLSYQRRNTLGLSLDFAEDVTKSNWSGEITWVNRDTFEDADSFDGVSKLGTYNLTVSVDRPTFINFLNESRTFFFNSQWFFQYVPGYSDSFSNDGPWNLLGTFTIQTGYFQDRLLPAMTTVYDMQSNSGALLPEIQYRFTESFSATFGFALFWGRYQPKTYPINPIGLDNNAGRGAYTNFVENALAVVRQRDEVFLRIRYTF